MPAEQLPEGTDAIVNGTDVDVRDDDTAAAPERTATSASRSVTGSNDEAPQSFTSRIEGLKGQAGDRARSFVDDAKTRATDSIDGVVQMIHDAAAEVDDKVGSQYGDYIRRAGDSVAALSDGLRNKDVDALFADARDLIQKSPGIAIGAAAALGFVVARLARAGVEDVAVASQPGKPA